MVINPASFSKKDIEKIKKNFKRVIETDAKDNNLMRCNLVSVDGAVVIGRGVSRDLQKAIKDEGWKVREVEMDEFLKGGGDRSSA